MTACDGWGEEKNTHEIWCVSKCRHQRTINFPNRKYYHDFRIPSRLFISSIGPFTLVHFTDANEAKKNEVKNSILVPMWRAFVLLLLLLLLSLMMKSSHSFEKLLKRLYPKWNAPLANSECAVAWSFKCRYFDWKMKNRFYRILFFLLSKRRDYSAYIFDCVLLCAYEIFAVLRFFELDVWFCLLFWSMMICFPSGCIVLHSPIFGRHFFSLCHGTRIILSAHETIAQIKQNAYIWNQPNTISRLVSDELLQITL